MKQRDLIRILNDASAPGMLRSAWRPGLTPFSDNIREHYPVLTDEMADEFVRRAGDRVLNPDVEEVGELLRLYALDRMVCLLRDAQLSRLGAPSTSQLIVPYGCFPRDDATVAATLPIWRMCGAAPVGGYIANSPGRQQFGKVYGTSLTEDIDRAREDAERLQRHLGKRSRVKIILVIHDHYVFPDFDPGDPMLPAGQVGGSGTERPLLDEAVAAYDELLRTAPFDGYWYWNEPGRPIDPRLLNLGAPRKGRGR
jgi:hypothetical protein